MGKCNGVVTACSIAGFALETGCHVGESIVFDTVTERDWSIDVRTHRIQSLIKNVLSEDWYANTRNGVNGTIGQREEEMDREEGRGVDEGRRKRMREG